jgi:hypothetical protein
MNATENTSTTQTAAVAAPGPHVTPTKVASTRKATTTKAAPKAATAAAPAKAKKAAKSAKAKLAAKKKAVSKPVAKKTASTARLDSKKAQVVALLQRKNGVTLVEIMDKMGWARHTVRGFMAGAMKKAGHTVESFKPEGGDRTYKIAAK